jgi:hypothetical protein
MATKKKAKRGKNVKQGDFFKEAGGLFNKNSEESVNPTKKFIQDASGDETIELTKTGESHFKALKKQKHIESMEPPILLDEFFHKLDIIKLNNSSFLEIEENDIMYEGVKYTIKNEDNTWLFFENKAVMLDYALMQEFSFEYKDLDILKYIPTFYNKKIFFVGTKDIHVYNLTEETWKTYSVSGQITSSIMLDDENIFLVVDFTKLICFNNKMKEAWSFITEGYLLNTPIIEDYIYISSSDGMLYKLDRDGDIIWSYNSKSSIETPPLSYQNTIIINSMLGKLFFISKDEKTELAVLDLGFHLLNKPIIKNNVLYAFNRRFLYKVDMEEYKLLDIIMFEKPIESISNLEQFIHIRTSDSKSIIADETFTNISITNFNATKSPLQHINFLISIDNNYNLLKTELI